MHTLLSIRRVVEQNFAAVVAALVVVSGCGGRATVTPQEELDVAGELDALFVCGLSALAELGNLERTSSGTREATTSWDLQAAERVRYGLRVFVHDFYGPGITVEPYRQSWAGAPGQEDPRAPFLRVAPVEIQPGWVPAPGTEDDRSRSQRAVYDATRCWEARRSSSAD